MVVTYNDDEQFARNTYQTLLMGMWGNMSEELRLEVVKAGLMKYYKYQQRFLKLCCLRFCGKISKSAFIRSIKNKHFKIYDTEKSYYIIIKMPMFFLACKEMRILPNGMFERYFAEQGINLLQALDMFKNWIEKGGISGYYAELSQSRSLQIIESLGC